jgi:hypothetical protein
MLIVARKLLIITDYTKQERAELMLGSKAGQLNGSALHSFTLNLCEE